MHNAVMVELPPKLRDLARGAARVESSGDTVLDVLTHLDTAFPGLLTAVRGEDGSPKAHFNLYVGEDDIRDLDGWATQTGPGDTVVILGAIAGG